MAKFALPIRSSYVPTWGPWEAIRELIQNAKDEEDANGNAMSVKHRGGNLVVTNQGADMDRSVLLLGKTTKAGRADLRGQFGEGLNLALLAAVRAGLSVVIYTQTERWTAAIEPAEEYGGEECLVVQTRKLQKRRSGVEVQMTLSDDDWEALRERLLFLCRIPDNRIVRVPNKGAILLEPERRGHIYVKGIYTATLDKLNFGYDLDHCQLDRDRRMVDVWDLQWKLGALFEQAVARRPELLQPEVYRMLRDEAEDTRQLHYHASMEQAEGLLERFHEEHGEDAIPVESIAESQELDHVGRRGIVVPKSLRDILQKKTGTVEEIRRDLLGSTTATYAWGDLTAEEKAALTWSCSQLDRASEALRGPLGPLMSRLEVVDFRDPKLQGTCQTETGTVRIARSIVGDPEELLTTLVHEEAHAVSEGGDGEVGHVRAIERLWRRLYFSKPSPS